MTEIRASRADHWDVRDPSPWVSRFAPLVPAGGAVLDLACGKGRHTRLFWGRGHPVTAVDRDVSYLGAAVRDAAGDRHVTVVEADLEAGPWPLEGQTFLGIVVTNYLYRPLLPHLITALAPRIATCRKAALPTWRRKLQCPFLPTPLRTRRAGPS